MKISKRIKRFLPKRVYHCVQIILSVFFRYKMLNKSKLLKSFDGTKAQGINLMGDIQAETGLGQSMRIIARTLKEGKIPFLIRQMDAPGELKRQERTWDNEIESHNRYGINLLHINNIIWEKSYYRIHKKELSGRYNIAYWLWELEEFPMEWTLQIETVDEIWTPSEFVSESIRKRTKKPVKTMPYGIEIDTHDLLERNYFGLPEDKFLFLVMYDFFSVSERKNPRGAIEAFKKAFTKTDSKIGLIIKANHAGNTEELDKLRREMADYQNVYFITDSLSRKEVESLIAAADVFVSLHRAEGFGLPLAEAMYLGTAVIATNWSAPTEFMNKDCSCLTDYELIELNEEMGPYHKGARWAEANIGQAAEYMKKLAFDRQYYNSKTKNGKSYIREYLSIDKMASKITERITEIYDMCELNVQDGNE